MIPVLTADLVTSCPGRDQGAMLSMTELRRRWSHKPMWVAPPEKPDDGFRMMAWCCDTDLIWRIVGPPEFVAELQVARGDGGGWRMYLCRHEIVGD